VIDEEMDEEVKITVVATGFDEQPTVVPKVEQKKPAFTPRPIIEEEPEIQQDQDELEIPAFIRKKIK
jgi:cell division protein FtsZ